jgi:hypothetical protein
MQRLNMALVALAERLVYQRSVLLGFGILSPQLNQASLQCGRDHHLVQRLHFVDTYKLAGTGPVKHLSTSPASAVARPTWVSSNPLPIRDGGSAPLLVHTGPAPTARSDSGEHRGRVARCPPTHQAPECDQHQQHANQDQAGGTAQFVVGLRRQTDPVENYVREIPHRVLERLQ